MLATPRGRTADFGLKRKAGFQPVTFPSARVVREKSSSLQSVKIIFAISLRRSFPRRKFFNPSIWNVSFPLASRKIFIDGEAFELPDNQTKTELFKYRHVKSLSIPLRDGSELTFRGNFPLMVQDSRQFGGRWFELRLAVGGKRERFLCVGLEC